MTGSTGDGPVLAATLAEAARRFGARPAVVAPAGWHLTYTDLATAVERVARGLRARGLGPAGLLGLCLPSSPDHLVAYLAAARCGAATVGINRRLPATDRRAIVDRLGPDLLITTADLDPGADVPALVVDPATAPARILPGLTGGEPAPMPPHDPDRAVALVLTSGTTGAPKAAVFTDRQIDAIRRIDHGDGWGGGGPMLVSTELVHVGVVTKLAWYLRSGATLHLLDHWRAEDALRVVVAERIPVIGAISAQVALLLRALDGHDVTHVQALIVGGGPSPPALVREARAAFGAGYSIRYSSTESGGVGTATGLDEDDEAVWATVGRPRPGVEVAIRDDHGDTVPIGAEGTVYLRSPAVMARYHDDPVRTAATLVGDGWLRTDDRGSLDADGRLTLVGRRGGGWVRGGYNVHPERVEAALVALPAVAEVAVVPRPDPVMGQVGVAVVVPADPAAPPTLADLRAGVARTLARHELPEDLRIVASLPRNATDKLDRRRLTAAVEAGEG